MTVREKGLIAQSKVPSPFSRTVNISDQVQNSHPKSPTQRRNSTSFSWNLNSSAPQIAILFKLRWTVQLFLLKVCTKFHQIPFGGSPVISPGVNSFQVEKLRNDWVWGHESQLLFPPAHRARHTVSTMLRNEPFMVKKCRPGKTWKKWKSLFLENAEMNFLQVLWVASIQCGLYAL